jgi:hypothetical protein
MSVAYCDPLLGCAWWDSLNLWSGRPRITCVTRDLWPFVRTRTLTEVRRELSHNARLEKGDGYFRFSGREASDWLDRTVKVPTLARVTI